MSIPISQFIPPPLPPPRREAFLLNKHSLHLILDWLPGEDEKGRALKEACNRVGKAVIALQCYEAPLLFHCFGVDQIAPKF